jgi:hypothetical protein
MNSCASVLIAYQATPQAIGRGALPIDGFAGLPLGAHYGLVWRDPLLAARVVAVRVPLADGAPRFPSSAAGACRAPFPSGSATEGLVRALTVLRGRHGGRSGVLGRAGRWARAGARAVELLAPEVEPDPRPSNAHVGSARDRARA